jgi:NAD(P)H-dependent FMN reductase
MNTTIILSSVRDNRLADIVYKKVKGLIGDKLQHTLVDPKEYNLPLLNLRYYEMKNPEPVFQKLHDIFQNTDIFLIITAEYNHSIPPALTNMLDHFGNEFQYKACGIVSYSDGPIAGARSTEQLRMQCSTLGMPPIPIAAHWGCAQLENESGGQEFVKNFERHFKAFLKQLIWYGEALYDKRAKS